MAESQREKVRYLENKLKHNPNTILFARLADSYLSAERIDEAIAICEEGIKKHPYYVTGHYIMGKCYLQKKQFDHAEKELKRVLLFDPNYIAAHREYGNLMAQIGWNNSCESSYAKILDIDPLNGNARQKLEEIRNSIQETDQPNEEIDIDLQEFEQTNVVPQDTSDSYNKVETREEDTIEEFEEAFTDKDHSEQTISQEDEEKFSYILDDIFRDDSETEETKSNLKPTETPFEREEPEQETSFEPPNQSDDQENNFSATEINESKTESSADNFWDIGIDEFKDEPSEDEKSQEFESTLEESFQKQPESYTPENPPDDEINEPVSVEHTIREREQPKKKEKIVTPTLGEIYAAQHQYAKAIGVYELLRKNEPDNPYYQEKIEYLKRKLEEDKSLE